MFNPTLMERVVTGQQADRRQEAAAAQLLKQATGTKMEYSQRIGQFVKLFKATISLHTQPQAIISKVHVS
jgi:hypothetical protein